MGAADLIPGISGGTIAFIMGFYHQLLDSVKTINLSSLKLLFTGRFYLFFQAVAWKFLLVLLAGVFFSFLTLASIFHFILEHETYRIYFYSVFFGLILASFWFCIRQITHWKWRHVIGLAMGIIIAYLYTGPFQKELTGVYAIRVEVSKSYPVLNNYDSEEQLLGFLSEKDLNIMLAKDLISLQTNVYHLNGELVGTVKDVVNLKQVYRIDPWLIVCGAIAISALLLPGISGSYLLTLLGVYPVAIGALSDLTQSMRQFSFDSDSFYVLFSLGIGIVLGLLLFARCVSWLLKRYPDFTVATLSGFMIGAIGSVWPFWNYAYYLNPLKIHKGPQLLLLDPIMPPLFSSMFALALFFALIGFFSVLLIERLSNTSRKSVSGAYDHNSLISNQK